MRSRTDEFCVKSLAFVGLVHGVLAVFSISGVVASFWILGPPSISNFYAYLVGAAWLLFASVGLMIFAGWMSFGWHRSHISVTPTFCLVSIAYEAAFFVGVVIYAAYLLDLSKEPSADLFSQVDLQHIAFFV